MNSGTKHLELIDRLRAVAIFAVMLFHTLGVVYGYAELPWRGWWRDFSVPFSFLCCLPLSFGQAGVAIFFVISGFCIHLSFQQPGRRWADFFVRRFFRIYPAYLVALVFFVWLFKEHYPVDLHSRGALKQLWAHFFLIHNLFPSTFSGINESFWSLGVEAQLYLLYPVLLLLVAKFGWRPAMVFLLGCELLIRGGDGWFEATGSATLLARICWLLANSPLGYWFSWALGAFIADAFLNNQPLPFLKSSTWGWALLAILSYFAAPLYPFRFLLFAVVTAVVTSKQLGGASFPVHFTAFSMGILQKIGLWSYSIYLLHQPLLRLYLYVIVWLFPARFLKHEVTLLLMAFPWVVIILFGCLWYHLFELPGIRLGKRLIDNRRAAPTRSQFPTAAVGQPRRRAVRSYALLTTAALVIVIGTFFVSTNLTPLSPQESTQKAWLLATSPDATKRNGALAVKLAENACQRTRYQAAIPVLTLAAAYAEEGRFEDAVATAQKACALASKAGDPKLLESNEALLNLFLQHQPYREPETPPEAENRP